jgi:predicted MFS family arabinose efflux permease
MADDRPVASPVRNIALLAVSNAIIGSNQTILAAIASLTAATMVSERSYATLPVTLMVLGTALCTGPAAWLIHTWGRREAFAFGAAVAIPAALLAALAAWLGSFALFCVALAILGATAAFPSQYRFAIADSVPPELKPRAISWVMLGGVVAAFLGPQIAILTKDLLAGHSFAGTYLAMGGLAAVAIGVLWLTRLAPTIRNPADRRAGRSLGQLLRSAEIVVPMLAASVTYALMILVMVSAPLAMVYICGYSTAEATVVIQWHAVAMFAPSFITGSVIARLGAKLTAAVGLLLIIAAAAVNLTGISVAHFTVALVLLGVGWNFGFIASTAMLSMVYRPEEAARVQGLNEQFVFGVMALASLSSGLLLDRFGWEAINVLAIPVAGAAILMLALSGAARGSGRRAPAT